MRGLAVGAGGPVTEAPIPVTVIGGYLGAGKTTVINHLLTAQPDRRLAVLVNDFGSINIDADLIEAHRGDTVALTNGCICCTIGDELGPALDRVLEAEVRPEHIVIEASGVADPGRIATYGQGWPGCRLDAVLVLVDPLTVHHQAGDRFVGGLILDQVRAADLVVVTKADLVDAERLEAVAAWVGEVAPDAGVVVVSQGRLDPTVALAPRTGAGPAAMGTPSAADSTPRGAPSGLRAMTVELDTDRHGHLDRRRLSQALDRWPASVVRVKGLVRLTPTESGADMEPRWHRVDRVGRRWSIEPLAADPPPGPDRLVLIEAGASSSTALDEDEVARTLGFDGARSLGQTGAAARGAGMSQSAESPSASEPIHTYSDSIEIEAPPDVVWSMVTDMERYGEWSSENQGGYWRKGADGEPGTGQVGDMFVGINRLGDDEWKAPVEIVERDEGRVFGFVTGGMEYNIALWQYVVEPSATGTRLTENYELRNLSPRMQEHGQPEIDVRWQNMISSIRATLENMKAAAEAG